MIKTLAVAALVGSLMSIPVAVAPAQAKMGANCLIFPLLQADCRAEIHDIVAAHHAAVVDPAQGPRFAWWWAVNCTRAADGSGHLLDCP
jgi:hypothetical protein